MARNNSVHSIIDAMNGVSDNEDSDDVEDGIIKDSVLQLTSNTFDEIAPDDFVGAKIRNINIASQSDIESEYKGVKVSRKSVSNAFSGSEESDSDSDDVNENLSGHDNEENEIEDNGSDDYDEDNDVSENLSGSGSDEDSFEREHLNDNKSNLNKTSITKSHNQNLEESDYKVYSKGAQNVTDDVEKGNAIRQQISIWEKLLECRIKLQKALLASNKLPQGSKFSDITSNFSESDAKGMSRACKSIASLLQLLIALQNTMMKSYPDFQSSVNRHSKVSEKKRIGDEEFDIKDYDNDDIADDESISSSIASGFSDEDNNEDSESEKVGADSEEPPPKKLRKLEDFSKELIKQHEEFIPARNVAIQKWNDKTRIASGRIKSSDFSMFDQATLKQIEQILCDKNRLIKRTQTKRSVYTVLGKDVDGSEENKSDPAGEIDPEIFDDDDFYHRLLRELIEEKSADITGTQQRGKQWIELQKMRSKMKRPTDTKASKGRRLRYTTHMKLVNFMAPLPYNSWTDEGESELFSSLFGEIKHQK